MFEFLTVIMDSKRADIMMMMMIYQGLIYSIFGVYSERVSIELITGCLAF